jgi:hypothetical protein
VTRCKQWHRLALPTPPPPPLAHLQRPVPADLIARCFNYLRTGHIAVKCEHMACYLRCHRVGHEARHYKWPRLPELAGPQQPVRRACCNPIPSVVALNPGGDITLVAPAA